MIGVYIPTGRTRNTRLRRPQCTSVPSTFIQLLCKKRGQNKGQLRRNAAGDDWSGAGQKAWLGVSALGQIWNPDRHKHLPISFHKDFLGFSLESLRHGGGGAVTLLLSPGPAQ